MKVFLLALTLLVVATVDAAPAVHSRSALLEKLLKLLEEDSNTPEPTTPKPTTPEPKEMQKLSDLQTLEILLKDLLNEKKDEKYIYDFIKNSDDLITVMIARNRADPCYPNCLYTVHEAVCTDFSDDPKHDSNCQVHDVTSAQKFDSMVVGNRKGAVLVDIDRNKRNYFWDVAHSSDGSDRDHYNGRKMWDPRVWALSHPWMVDSAGNLLP